MRMEFGIRTYVLGTFVRNIQIYSIIFHNMLRFYNDLQYLCMYYVVVKTFTFIQVLETSFPLKEIRTGKS
jgi:hypothetical protein